jgi:precorrin-6B methylase 2
VGQVNQFLLHIYRRTRHAVGRVVFERRQTVDTSQTVWLESLGLDHPDRVHYQPSPWTMLGSVLPKDAVRPTDVFVDFGSGMGRLVQQAAKYPFARVIGVEISEDLTEIARQNFERNRKRFECQNVELVTSDAVEFEVPDDMTHAYFNNPFTGETFKKVIDNITASIDRSPRRVTLIYEHPKMTDVLEATGRFQLVSIKRGVHIYGSVS